ncbi:MAG: rRNA maturation RNase YbeY [Rubricoccaceae bacterium]
MTDRRKSEQHPQGHATPSGLEIHAAHPTRQLDPAHVEAVVEAVCQGEGVRIVSLSVVLADRETVWAVNRDWLQHDSPTDVVSFVLDEEAQARGEIDGEIYVDLDMAAERAGEFDATPEHEALRYVVHGLLHLVGYDDATDAERAAMRQLEDRYLG